MTNEFSTNLRAIAASRRSVSELCRELGFNRQQFARYLTGEAKPSPHNLMRISEGLSIPEDDLLKPHNLFRAQYIEGRLGRADFSLLDRAFPGEIRKLRPLLGYYHGYFEIPESAGVLVRSFIELREQDGKVISKSIERRMRDEASGYLSKYQGLVSFLGNCIFVVEFEYLSGDSLVETILFPPYRKKLDVLTGLTFGVTSRVHRQPFASGIIWKFIGKSTDVRQGLSRCGRVSLQDKSLDPSVRRYFTSGAGGRLTSVNP
jgi:transcriptional regulator with XRE-family HTH domain